MNKKEKFIGLINEQSITNIYYSNIKGLYIATDNKYDPNKIYRINYTNGVINVDECEFYDCGLTHQIVGGLSSLANKLPNFTIEDVFRFIYLGGFCICVGFNIRR